MGVKKFAQVECAMGAAWTRVVVLAREGGSEEWEEQEAF